MVTAPNQTGWVALTSLTGTEVVPVDNGGAVTTYATTLQIGQLFSLGSQVVTVTASDAQTLTSAHPFTAFHYTTTITALTVTLPASPVQGQYAGFSVDHAVTTLSVTSGSAATVIAAPTSAAAGADYGWFYNVSDTTWYKRQ